VATCKAVNYAGIVCNQKAENATYFWFYDPCGRLNKVFHLCKLHSNLIIDELMVTENSYSKLIKACFDRIEKLRKELQSGNNLSEQREAIKNARENGNPEPKFKSVMEIKNNISDLYTKVNNSKKVLVNERNRICRFCRFPLREPELPKDQIGNSFTPVDFKLARGFRRVDFLFHTECSITWITNKLAFEEKELSKLSPKRTKQETIFTSLEENNQV
jgi:hypothetical protein